MAIQSHYTRTGVRRSGDEYQDLVAIQLAIDMLSHPSRYKWMELEASEVGALDDVVALKSNGTLVLRQVKFSTNPEDPEDPYTWAKLLCKKSNRANSLLKKWSDGLQKAKKRASKLNARLIDAAVVTNRRLSPELGELVNDGRIVRDRLDSDTEAQILAQLGQDELTDLCELLRFETNSPDMQELEDKILQNFTRLGGTSEGWYSLGEAMRRWVYTKNEPAPAGQVTVHELRRAARWRPLESIPQDFPIPQDFVLPDKGFHEKLHAAINDPAIHCLVLTGSPGAGKSTYLSYLTSEFSQKNVAFIRHHYWLTEHEARLNRIEFETVARSLISQLHEKYPQSIGNLEGRNPNPQELRAHIETASAYFAAQSQRLVIIVDGLDHVQREIESNMRPLADLLDQVLVRQPGAVVILGTQPLAEGHFPNALVRAAPQETWRKLPLLDVNAVKNILLRHASELELTPEGGVDGYWFDELARELQQKSHGHPLHLRFSIEELRELALPISIEVIRKLPDCPGSDIRAYYRNLLHNLPAEAALVLQVLVEAPFAMKTEEIGACLRHAECDIRIVYAGFRSVRHLLRADVDGWMPHHGSIRQYVKETSDYGLGRSTIRSAILEWLNGLKEDVRKWSFSWRLQAEWNSDSKLLRIGPNRKWAVECLMYGSPRHDAKEILRASVIASLKAGDLPRFVRTGILKHYFEGAEYTIDEMRSALIEAHLAMAHSEAFAMRTLSRFDRCELDEALSLLRFAHARSMHVPDIVKNTVVAECQRLADAVAGGESAWNEELEKLAAVCSYVEGTSERIRFLLQFHNRTSQEQIIVTACRELVRSRNVAALKSLYETLATRERRIAAQYLAYLALEEGLAIEALSFNDPDDNAPLVSTALYLKNLRENDGSLVVPDWNILIDDRQDLLVAERMLMLFWSYFAKGVNREELEGKMDMPKLDAPKWTTKFLLWLARQGHRFGRDFESETESTFESIFEAAEILGPRPYKFGEELHLRPALLALTRVSLELLRLHACIGRQVLVTKDSLECAMKCTMFSVDYFIEQYIQYGRKVLSEEAAQWIIDEVSEHIFSNKDYCASRAIEYGSIVRLAAFHELEVCVEKLARAMSENLIAHGFRKDTLFFHVLDCLEHCQETNGGEMRDALLRLGPAIAWVRDYTDGSETSGLPSYYGRRLAKSAPDVLPRFYIWLAEQERYHDAEDILHIMLKEFELALSGMPELSSTAIDLGSIDVLRGRFECGELGAEEILEDLGPYANTTCGEVVNSGIQTVQERVARPEWKSPIELDVAQFPPPNLVNLLSNMECTPGLRRDRVMQEWVRHWESVSGASAIVDALLVNESKLSILMPARDMYRLIRSTRGREEAYPWLVKAFIAEDCWNVFIGKTGAAEWYWTRVQSDYPERWELFLRQTIEDQLLKREYAQDVFWCVGRIVRYLIACDQVELANRTCLAVLDASLEYVSCIPLEVPPWCSPTAP